MGKRVIGIVGGLAVFGVVIVIAIAAYIYISGGSGEASEDVNANAQKLEANEPNEVVFRIDQNSS